MKAAIVGSFESLPRFGTFEEPAAGDGETLVAVAAAAVSPLVKSVAAGRHYSSNAVFPFVPGIDGVGRLDSGQRVYFAFPRAPFGAMAAAAPVRTDLCVPVPDDVDDATAAAIANPAMSAWAALTVRAKLQRGESVFVNGATGVAGRMAVQIAKFLGAKTVIASGRNPDVLASLPALGADVVIRLSDAGLHPIDALRSAIETHHVGIILDYLWGVSAEQLFGAIATGGSHAGAPHIRFVQIGASSGPRITLDAGSLRSSGVELLGSGIGSVSVAGLVACVGEALRAVGPAHLRIEVEARGLEDVTTAWNHDFGERRLVFTL